MKRTNLEQAQIDALLTIDYTDRDAQNHRAALYVVGRLGDVAARREVLEALGLIPPVVELETLSKAQRARVARNRRRHAQKARERADSGMGEGAA